ncbi:MAG: DUF3540 domain-containing protein [Polyangiaceae bacterium]|nr:DUF3540 domain-containing protein [Myxococcales bacterium]MCB9590902.1 DUF3540 domain-containing protein [Polyangiaceae bacterium]
MSELVPPEGKRVSALIEGRAPRHIHFRSGARAVACDEQLELHASDGRLIACFDAGTGALVLHSAGDLTLLSAGRLKLKSAEAVELDAPRVSSNCREFSLQAAEAEVEVTSWRLRAQRIVEHSTDVYRRVERVYETRAQSIRTIARRSLSFLAERASLVSREETRVDGKRVLLG